MFIVLFKTKELLNKVADYIFRLTKFLYNAKLGFKRQNFSPQILNLYIPIDGFLLYLFSIILSIKIKKTSEERMFSCLL